MIMIIIVMVILFILSAFLLFWQISNFVSVFYGCLYVGTRYEVIKKALMMAKFKKGQIFYELGCGTGTVLLEAEKFGVKVVGFEISPFYFLISKLRTWQYPNIKVKFQDIRKVDFSKADIIYCYLLPEFLEKLSPKFKKELKKSARLISVGFPIPGLKNKKITTINSRKIFTYSPSSRSA